MRRRIPHEIKDGVEIKYCKVCDQWYPLSEFNSKQASWDGKETKCKSCAQQKSAKFRQENPTYDKSYQQKNLEDLRNYKREYYKKKKLSTIS